MNFTEEIKGKKVLIFGLGLQGGGLGDALWLNRHGSLVRVTDQKTPEELGESLAQLPKDIELTLAQHKESDIDWADIIIKNPGVPDNSPFMQYARNKDIPVYTSIALVVKEARDKIIGVTGTRGKSTTTELIYQLLKKVYGDRVQKGGNIPGSSGLSLLDQIDTLDYLVLELSSFQLHNLHDLQVSPKYAVVTNMYPDHLNRYAGMEEYFSDKASITKYQRSSDTVVAFKDNEYSTRLAELSPGDHVFYQASDVPIEWETHLRGPHNTENIAALLKLAQVLKIKQSLVQEVVESFPGLPFRLEDVATIGGVTYINDTTSTTPTSTIKAIRALNQPTVLIVGGDDKKLPVDELIEEIASTTHVQKIVILGSKNIPDFVNKLKDNCKEKILGQVFSMKEAVQLASRNAQDGWAVLLSPGFFSFDLFKNEFDRGRQFNEIVNNLN